MTARHESAVDLRSRLARDLRAAMRERDRAAVAALRGLLARWANAEALPVDTLPSAGAIEGAFVGVGAADAPRKELTVDDLVALAEAEAQEHEDAADERNALLRTDEATTLRRQAQVIRALLRPKDRRE